MVMNIEGVGNENKRNRVNTGDSYLSYININAYVINHINMEGNYFDQ